MNIIGPRVDAPLPHEGTMYNIVGYTESGMFASLGTHVASSVPYHGDDTCRQR